MTEGVHLMNNEKRNHNFLVSDAFNLGCTATAAILGERLDLETKNRIIQLIWNVAGGVETLVDSPAEFNPLDWASEEVLRRVKADLGDDVVFGGQTQEAFAMNRAVEIATANAIVRSMDGQPPEEG